MGNTGEEKDLQKQTQNNSENGHRNTHITNYLKREWIKCSNQKTQAAEWIQKQDPYICCLQETHFRPRDTYRLKVREWKKIFHANGNQKKAGVAILISDKIDFELKNVTRDKEGYYVMIKGSIQEEDITIVHIDAPNIAAPQYIRQMVTAIKGETDSNTIIVGNFKTPLLLCYCRFPLLQLLAVALCIEVLLCWVHIYL